MQVAGDGASDGSSGDMGQGPSTSRKPRSSLPLRSAVLQRTERAAWGSSETVAGILEFGAIWTESQPNGSPAAPPGAVTSHMTEKSGRPAWLRIPCVGGLILHESMNLHFSNSPQMKELPLPPPLEHLAAACRASDPSGNIWDAVAEAEPGGIYA